MFSWWNRLVRENRGVAAVEFALVTPIVFGVMLVVVEIGRALTQAQAIEKGLRAGALLAARSDWPLPGATQTQVQNLVRTGTLDGTGDLLAEGWSEPGATLSITSTTTTVGGNTIPVIRLSAQVPFSGLMPGLMSMFSLDDMSVSATHDQPYIGN